MVHGWLLTTKSEKVYFCYKQDDNFTVIMTGYRKRMRVRIHEKIIILPLGAEMIPHRAENEKRRYSTPLLQFAFEIHLTLACIHLEYPLQYYGIAEKYLCSPHTPLQTQCMTVHSLKGHCVTSQKLWAPIDLPC